MEHELIKRKCTYHIETSQLICQVNHLCGYDMKATLAFNELMQVSSRINYSLLTLQDDSKMQSF